MRTRADELCASFHEGLQGKADIDVPTVVETIIMDIIHSAGLAVEEAVKREFFTADNHRALSIRREVEATVTDYYGNYYGEL